MVEKSPACSFPLLDSLVWLQQKQGGSKKERTFLNLLGNWSATAEIQKIVEGIHKEYDGTVIRDNVPRNIS